jgi:thioredoxin reductase
MDIDAAATDEIACDLCILGAGIAGLNALFAASRHLARNQKVVLVDRNAAVGGMWLSTYDYVRLHQPHPMFTAGDIAWTLGKEPSYLATRREVVAHLAHCIETTRRRVTLDERFGYEYRSHDESGAGPDEVLVHCVSTTAGAPALRIRAKKLIKAFGVNVRVKEPLAVSSAQVRSISPDRYDLLGEEMRASDAPVYVIGGGKTGMDTAYALLTRFPHKRVSLVIGSGTMFGSRDKLYPAGLRRGWGGYTPVQTFLDLSHRFNGRNEREVLEHLRAKYTVSLVPDARRFMLGLLSQHENDVIASGAHEVIRDYFVDVIDRDGCPMLLLRSGQSRPIEAGSWIINCSGYILQDEVPYEPYVSASGKVVSIQSCSAIHVLTSCAAYLAVHLSYLNKLHELPLYEMDFGALYRADRDVFSASIGPHTLYNMYLILSAVPKAVLDEFGTDAERWYPLPRRLLDLIRITSYQRRNPDHLRRTLDTIRERFSLRCGPLALAHAPVRAASSLSPGLSALGGS